MNFKDRLREELEYQGLSGKELAAKIGISYSTFLSYIDARGVLPNVETAVKIVEVPGVTVEYLVNGKLPKPRIPAGKTGCSRNTAACQSRTSRTS